MGAGKMGRRFRLLAGVTLTASLFVSQPILAMGDTAGYLATIGSEEAAALPADPETLGLAALGVAVIGTGIYAVQSGAVSNAFGAVGSWCNDLWNDAVGWSEGISSDISAYVTANSDGSYTLTSQGASSVQSFANQEGVKFGAATPSNPINVASLDGFSVAYDATPVSTDTSGAYSTFSYTNSNLKAGYMITAGSTGQRYYVVGTAAMSFSLVYGWHNENADELIVSTSDSSDVKIGQDNNPTAGSWYSTTSSGAYVCVADSGGLSIQPFPVDSFGQFSISGAGATLALPWGKGLTDKVYTPPSKDYVKNPDGTMTAPDVVVLPNGKVGFTTDGQTAVDATTGETTANPANPPVSATDVNVNSDLGVQSGDVTESWLQDLINPVISPFVNLTTGIGDLITAFENGFTAGSEDPPIINLPSAQDVGVLEDFDTPVNFNPWTNYIGTLRSWISYGAWGLALVMSIKRLITMFERGW